MDSTSHVNSHYNTWYWLKQSTGEVKDFNCGSWSCQRCSPGIAYRWALTVVKAAPQRMITLTNIPSDRQEATLAYSTLVQDIRRQGWSFDYARFLEAGKKTGMLHWHLAQIGDFLPQRWLSAHARKAGLGEVADIRACTNEGPAFYVAKYITKDAAPAGWRKVSLSRGFPRPEKISSQGDWILMQDNR